MFKLGLSATPSHTAHTSIQIQVSFEVMDIAERDTMLTLELMRFRILNRCLPVNGKY
jgi:hypothetical protein